MKTDCEHLMDDYLALDKNGRIPPHLTRHLLLCKQCRSQVRLLSRAEKIAAQPLAAHTPLSDSGILRVMRAIDPAWSEEKAQPFSPRNWIFGGILMIVFMLAFRLFRVTTENDTLSLAFYLIFAVAVIAYCAIFVGTNLDFLVKKRDSLQTA